MRKILYLLFFVFFHSLNSNAQTIFGSASFGGSAGYGALYSCDSKTGKISFLHNFSQVDGIYPNGVYAVKNGVIYGTTGAGGKKKLGTIFEYIPSAKYFKVLHVFDSTLDGGQAVGCIRQFSDNKFYGMLDPIKTTPGYGRLFKYDPISNKDSICFTFTGPNGKYGSSDLIQASNGLLYGVTTSGGKYNYGVLFSYNIITGKDSVVLNFDSINNGSTPWSYFVQAPNGLLYGFTEKGGAHNKGVLISYNTITGKDSVLIQFSGNNGAYPYASPLIDKNGELYGTTDSGGVYGKGVLFEYNIASGKDTILINFSGSNGNIPTYIVADSNNNIFGGSWSGGANNDGMF
ncbi:MAG TPA: choice-of-anchor tandem repeat GloVer-containing protein, partial [Bacteroidia bacterium]|nr:choice-of-anchor tandem repeat GloVer-containing protein [Bacteroidia bacterium]